MCCWIKKIFIIFFIPHCYIKKNSYICQTIKIHIMKNLFKALAAFQQEVPVIHKGTQGYGYSYADLPKIFEVINPLLQKHGLGFTQLINGQTIVTVLFHSESGEQIDSQTDIPQGVQLKGMNDFQVLGSAITYLRRYALSSILGIVTDKDVDAAGEQIKTEAKKPKIDVIRFEKALEAIEKGEFTADQLKEKFELTELQQKALLLI
jgi:hypothetical protein